MTDLLLDDIGLLLLRNLHEARESRDVEKEVIKEENEERAIAFTYINELWRRDAEYMTAVQSYVDHLVFIRDTPSYDRLTYRLHHFGALYTRDVMKLVKKLKPTTDIADIHWIGQVSLEYYQWYLDIPPLTGDAP
jgi:hypothetical protein